MAEACLVLNAVGLPRNRGDEDREVAELCVSCPVGVLRKQRGRRTQKRDAELPQGACVNAFLQLFDLQLRRVRLSVLICMEELQRLLHELACNIESDLPRPKRIVQFVSGFWVLHEG